MEISILIYINKGGVIIYAGCQVNLLDLLSLGIATFILKEQSEQDFFFF